MDTSQLTNMERRTSPPA